ncbi:MAG: hypothetical protein M3443_09910 [Actinomycetota bacterium]|nr:hypothetical protein [Actinomycetota bacterium]
MIGVGALHVLFVGVLTAGLLSGAAATGQVPNRVVDMSDRGARVGNLGLYRAEAPFALPLSTVLFLAGVLLSRAGALENSERGRRIHYRLSGWGIGVGLPLNIGDRVRGR